MIENITYLDKKAVVEYIKRKVVAYDNDAKCFSNNLDNLKAQAFRERSTALQYILADIDYSNKFDVTIKRKITEIDSKETFLKYYGKWVECWNNDPKSTKSGVLVGFYKDADYPIGVNTADSNCFMKHARVVEIK